MDLPDQIVPPPPNAALLEPASPQPATTDSQPSPKYNHRRTGTVAQLPHAIREQINQMLLDGVTFAGVVEKLGDTVKDLKDEHVRRWHEGGYQDWLNQKQRADDLGATREAALKLVDQKAGATVQDAGRTIAATQLYELLLSFDPRGFARALDQKPELYFRLINSLSRLTEGEAAWSRRRAQGSLIESQINPEAPAEGPPIISEEKLKHLIKLIKLI
jgi:hypothetical protein